MTLQDQIESFQKLIFSHFRGSANNECRISALVPLVKESFGIYKFITSMVRAMHRRESWWDVAALTFRYGRRRCSLAASRAIQCSAFQSEEILLRMLQPEIPHRSHQCAKAWTSASPQF